jgi:putative FmdB family regulatory protein
MPIYEYQCQACGYQFDKIQKMSDAVLTDCPQCDKPELKKLISAPSFKLTGTGWYETDFKKPKTGAKTESAKTDSAPETEKKAEKSTASTAETSKTD